MTQELSGAERAALEAELLARRADLKAERSERLDGASRVEHARELLLSDADDGAQHDTDREVDLARFDREALELAAINAALIRMANGDYGFCDECGEPIPLARLKIEPQALRCVACESQLERDSGQTHPSM